MVQEQCGRRVCCNRFPIKGSYAAIELSLLLITAAAPATDSHLLPDGGADVGAGLEHHGVRRAGAAAEADLGDGLAQLGVGTLQDVVRPPKAVRRLKGKKAGD